MQCVIYKTCKPRMPKMMKKVQQIRTMLPIGRSEDRSVWTTSFSPGARLMTLCIQNSQTKVSNNAAEWRLQTTSSYCGKAAKTVLSVLLITSLLPVLIPEASLLAVMMSDNALYDLALTYSLPIPYSQHFWRLDLEPYHVLKRSGVLIANTKCTQSWTWIWSIHGLDWILLDWVRILRKLCGLDWVRWLQSSVFFSFMYFLY